MRHSEVHDCYAIDEPSSRSAVSLHKEKRVCVMSDMHHAMYTHISTRRFAVSDYLSQAVGVAYSCPHETIFLIFRIRAGCMYRNEQRHAMFRGGCDEIHGHHAGRAHTLTTQAGTLAHLWAQKINKCASRLDALYTYIHSTLTSTSTS